MPPLLLKTLLQQSVIGDLCPGGCIWLTLLLQSFLIAFSAIVFATFTTGLDSASFSVLVSLSRFSCWEACIKVWQDKYIRKYSGVFCFQSWKQSCRLCIKMMNSNLKCSMHACKCLKMSRCQPSCCLQEQKLYLIWETGDGFWSAVLEGWRECDRWSSAIQLWLLPFCVCHGFNVLCYAFRWLELAPNYAKVWVHSFINLSLYERTLWCDLVYLQELAIERCGFPWNVFPCVRRRYDVLAFLEKHVPSMRNHYDDVLAFFCKIFFLLFGLQHCLHVLSCRWSIDVGWSSTWVKIVNEWLAAGLYSK